ncbi:MAG TPA: hypothetical protein VGE77_12630 [Nocardioides sp.]
MADPDAFDAFYKDARDRLLAQTYLLTGDLPAARSAVREAFVVGWHHWSKVNARGEPETEVRPRAWANAARRATTRPWHREKGIDPEVARTLEVLGDLDWAPRRMLVLAEVARLPLAEAAREVGVTVEDGAQHLAVGRAELAAHRGLTTPEELEAALSAVTATIVDTRWPRPSILRRAGRRRRRLHTVGGVALACVAIVVSGAVVHDADGTATSLARSVDRDAPSAPASPAPVPEIAEGFTTAQLLPGEEVELLSPDSAWTSTTSDNTGGDGLVLPCQQSRYADPEGLAGFVSAHTASASDGTSLRAFQASELSRDPAAAGTTFESWATWFGGCDEGRAQLVETYDVAGVGDDAMAFVVRVGGPPSSVVTAAVARTGDVTTAVVADTGSGADEREPVVNLLASAVDRVCDSEAGGACSTSPALEPRLPVATGDAPLLLDLVDLPAVSGIDLPWSGTRPTAPEANPAATVCDRASFAEGVADPTTRTFVIPDAGLPATFGLAQTSGRLSDQQVADGFVGTIADRMADCVEQDLVTSARVIGSGEYDDGRMSVWRLAVRVDEESTVRVLMGVARVGNLVTQVGFVPAGDADVDDDTFVALVERARERLLVAAAAG